MAQGRDFPVLFPLYDVTIDSLAPATTGQITPVSGSYQASGQNTYLFVTPNTIPNGSGALSSGLAADALLIEVTPPVVTNGGQAVYPDFQLWPYPDSTSLRSPTPAGSLLFDGSYGGNMLPPRERTVGREQVALGISLRRLLTEARNGHPRNNMALLATGIKYNSTFQLQVSSQRGWGPGVPGDTVVTPARVRVWGERYTERMLDLVASFWNGAFTHSGIRRQLEATEVPPSIAGVQTGRVSIADIATLPGGYHQSGAQIFRYFSFAYPAVQTSTSSPYFLTNSTNVGGTPGNVNQQYSGDLGFPFGPVNGVQSNAKSAVIVQQFGVTPGNPNIAYAGFQVGGASVPDPNGFPVGYSADRIAYGNVQPIRADSALWYALPDLEGEIAIFGENASVFITANGTAIQANSVAVAVGGVSIQLP